MQADPSGFFLLLLWWFRGVGGPGGGWVRGAAINSIVWQCSPFFFFFFSTGGKMGLMEAPLILPLYVISLFNNCARQDYPTGSSSVLPGEGSSG